MGMAIIGIALLITNSADSSYYHIQPAKKKLPAPEPEENYTEYDDNQVEATRTVITINQAKQYLTNAFVTAIKRQPTKSELAMLMAQSSLETRHWQAMWNWNFGNITSGGKYKWFSLKDDHKYRNFDSPQKGALYFVLFLQRRYPKAWDLLASEDPNGFAYALKEQDYYEGNPDKYGQLLSSQYSKYYV